MKQMIIWAALAAAMMTASCMKEVPVDKDTLSGAGISFRVLPEDTKTAFGPKGGDGKYPVVWTEDDKHIAVNLNGANNFLDAARVKDEGVRFRISGSLPTASSYTFYAVSPYAAAKSASDAGSKGVCLNVELPASQTTLTTGPDAAAQLLYAVSDTFDELPSGVDLSFGHIPAYLHLVFVNAALEGQVQSVSVSSDELDLAGRMNFYPKDGSFTADNMVKEVTVATSQLADVWCAVAPADLSGKTLRFDVATTSGHTFKEVTFGTGRALRSGKSVLITFDMGSGSTIVIDGDCTFNASFAESIVPTASIPSWANPSSLNIYGSAGSAQLALASTSGSDAVFSGNASMTGPFSAIYSQGGSVSYADGHLGFVLPAEQTVSGSADPTALAAVAFSSTLDMSFKNVSSLLKVTVEEEGIKQIVVRATDGTALAGTVQVNPVTGAVIGISGGSDSITLNPSGETFATGDYYISAIPSGNDLELSVIALRSSDVRKGLVETARTLVRASAVETAASSSLDWAYRIGSNADLRAWAADKDHWNAAGEDVYIVSDINMNDEPWTALTDSYGGRILGGGHCISHINIQSSTSANVGFFGKGYAKELHDLTFGSEDGLTYDGTSCIINGLVTESTSAKWNYTGLVTVAAADIVNVTNFVPMTVLASSNRSSRVAGIAGWTTDLVHITGCHNYGTITVEDHAITTGSDYVYLAAAGILGGLNTSVGEAYVNDCHNHALITSTSHCQNAMGGIVGMSYHTVNKLSVTNCTNSGRIELIYTATQNENFCMGGIVGKATGAAGKEVEIKGCTNTGAIYSEAVHQHYVGGIAGYGDGVSISSCRNEGAVAIDHSKAASARFQHVGGILGATMPKYGANNLSGNVNMGRVSMKVASSGHNSSPKPTTTFYGVNAGGILGCANNVSSLSGNRNEGDVVAENDYKSTNTSYPALVHVGGIVGYDFGTLDGFSSNTFTGTVTGKTTNASSVASEVYAGGIIGRQRAAMMLSGAGEGHITTQAAVAGAARYAGSIAGYNDGTIEACTYSGTVDGAEATASNTVGGGNAPQSSGQITLNATIDGYRGIWYDLGQVEEGQEEYGSKYSGGLGSYSMKHIPMAIYSPVVNRTYFVFGGTANYIDGVTTAEEQGRLLCMIGCYDHTTGMLQKPRIVMDKTATPLGKSDNGTGRVYDPHDNPTVQIDKNGYIFVFVSGRSTKRHGAIFRSRKPYDITSFETIKNDDFMGYPQVMYHPDKGFLLFFTRYDGTRRLFYRTSEDGINWPGPVAPKDSTQYESMKLASIHAGQTKSGHYQISNMWGTKICTAFNRHPNGTVNERTNVYYVQTTDWGETWTTAAGEPVDIPVVTWNSNCLVRDYQNTTETHNCYIKDLNFDANGNPIILYLTSRNHMSGPSGGTRQWWTDHWTGSEWVRREITTSTHNYDSGSLWVEGNDWVVLAPTDAGHQFWGAGGEVVRWRSSDEGLSWVKEMTLTSNSQNNQTYMRRPWYAADGFYSFWADGNTMTLSRSYLYFCDKAGNVLRMPYNMTSEWAYPEAVR